MLNFVPDASDTRAQDLALRIVEQLPVAAHALDAHDHVIWNGACNRPTTREALRRRRDLKVGA